MERKNSHNHQRLSGLISNFQPSENEISNKLFEKYKTNLNKLNKMQSQMIIKNMMTTDNVKPQSGTSDMMESFVSVDCPSSISASIINHSISNKNQEKIQKALYNINQQNLSQNRNVKARYMNKLTQNVIGDKFNFKNECQSNEKYNQFKRKMIRLEQETQNSKYQTQYNEYNSQSPNFEMNKHNTDFLVPALCSPDSGLNQQNDQSPYKNKNIYQARERNKMLTGNLGMLQNNNESMKFRNLIQNINSGTITSDQELFSKQNKNKIFQNDKSYLQSGSIKWALKHIYNKQNSNDEERKIDNKTVNESLINKNSQQIIIIHNNSDQTGLKNLIQKINNNEESLQSWMVQRDKLSLSFLKKENEKLKNELYNTKIFLNMVIHDLRNPANQINYTLEFAIQNLLNVQQILIESLNLNKQNFQKSKNDLVELLLQLNEQVQQLQQICKDQQSQIKLMQQNHDERMKEKDKLIEIMQQQLMRHNIKIDELNEFSLSKLEIRDQAQNNQKDSLINAQSSSSQIIDKSYNLNQISNFAKESKDEKQIELRRSKKENKFQRAIKHQQKLDKNILVNEKKGVIHCTLSDSSISSSSECQSSDLDGYNITTFNEKSVSLQQQILNLNSNQLHKTSLIQMKQSNSKNTKYSKIVSGKKIFDEQLHFSFDQGKNMQIVMIEHKWIEKQNYLQQIESLSQNWDEAFQKLFKNNLLDGNYIIQQQDMIKGCKHSTVMLLNLLDDLLDLAKQEKLTFQFNKSYFNLIDAVNNTFKILEFLSEKKQVKMYLHIHPNHIKYFQQIFGDQKRFEQILLNFSSNALKFSNENGLVKIELIINNIFKINDKICQSQEFIDEMKRNQNLIQIIEEYNLKQQETEIKDQDQKQMILLKYQIKIIDSGYGISKEGIKDLFQDFIKLKEHSNINQGGTGLGLQICKKIIQKMGGKISISSQIGVGTTFTIDLTTLSMLQKSQVKKKEKPKEKSFSQINVNRGILDYKADQALIIEKQKMQDQEKMIMNQISGLQNIDSEAENESDSEYQNDVGNLKKSKSLDDLLMEQDFSVVQTRDIQLIQDSSNNNVNSNIDENIRLSSYKISVDSSSGRGLEEKLIHINQQKSIQRKIQKNHKKKQFIENDKKENSLQQSQKNSLVSFASYGFQQFINENQNQKNQQKVNSGQRQQSNFSHLSNFQLDQNNIIDEEDEIMYIQDLNSKQIDPSYIIQIQNRNVELSNSSLNQSPLQLQNKSIASLSIQTRQRNQEENKEESRRSQDSINELRDNLNDRKQREQIMFEQNLRILLVNDEYMQLMILENILVRILGIPQENVDKAENGQIANKKAIEGNFDIIIMDLNMPVMNGFTAAKSIKDYFKNEGRICPYIVALSASHIDQMLISQCQQSGFDDWFSSPLTYLDIQNKIINQVNILKKQEQAEYQNSQNQVFIQSSRQ